MARIELYKFCRSAYFAKEFAIFRRIVVLTQSLNPAEGALAHAMDWACHYHAPLYIRHFAWNAIDNKRDAEPSVRLSSRDGRGNMLAPDKHRYRNADPLIDVCQRLGVSVKIVECDLALEQEMPSNLFASDLVAIDPGLPMSYRRNLLRQRKNPSGPAILLCAAQWQPVDRVIAVHEQGKFSANFFARLANLSRLFQARVIVLITARSERLALSEERILRDMLMNFEMDVETDILVGGDVRTAAASVARWRQCQVIALQHEESQGWWRWWRGGASEELLNHVNWCSCLSLQGSGDVSQLPSRLTTGTATGAFV